MIRRDLPDRFILITQHDHSRLSGELARRIGNTLFAPPFPFDSVIRAITDHDCGWAPHDNHAQLNPTGQPAHVFETEITIAIAAWTASVDQLIILDPYAGLLVSLHAMALANHAAARQLDVADEIARQNAFHVRRFAHRQIEVQEDLRHRLDMRTDSPLRGGLADPNLAPEEDLLRANFYLLEFLDQLSLNLCFDRLVFKEIDPVYPRPNEQPLAIKITRDPDGAMRLSPWPFNSQTLDLQIPARTIPLIPHPDPAPPESVHVRLHA